MECKMESKVPDIKRLIDVIPHQLKSHPKNDALCDKACLLYTSPSPRD